MKRRWLILGMAIGLLAGWAWPLVASDRAQVGLSIKPAALRYRLFGDEPIATPDGRMVLNGWKVIVLRDTRADQCYTAVVMGSAMSVTGPAVCPTE